MHRSTPCAGMIASVAPSRKATGEVIAGPAVEPHPLTILACDDSESIVLNLMQPLAAGRQLIGFGGEARRDETGREGRCNMRT
jgi:hypothetical protein